MASFRPHRSESRARTQNVAKRLHADPRQVTPTLLGIKGLAFINCDPLCFRLQDIPLNPIRQLPRPSAAREVSDEVLPIDLTAGGIPTLRAPRGETAADGEFKELLSYRRLYTDALRMDEKRRISIKPNGGRPSLSTH